MPSPYEENALNEIAAWKHPALGWLGTAMRVVNWPLDKAGDAVMKMPGVGWVLEKSIGGLVNVTNDAARWSVRPDAIFEEYRKAGHDVRGHADLRLLDLEHVDRTIGWLRAKYKGMSLLEGGGFGGLGFGCDRRRRHGFGHGRHDSGSRLHRAPGIRLVPVPGRRRRARHARDQRGPVHQRPLFKQRCRGCRLKFERRLRWRHERVGERPPRQQLADRCRLAGIEPDGCGNALWLRHPPADRAAVHLRSGSHWRPLLLRTDMRRAAGDRHDGWGLDGDGSVGCGRRGRHLFGRHRDSKL